MRNTRPISWIKAARKAFLAFPEDARLEAQRALTIAAEGGMASVAKPLHGLGGGIFEIALRHRGDAFRVVYAVRIGDALWVIHAFQKKSISGIKTSKADIDLVIDRLKHLKDMMK